jgi:hypothetical protein
MIFPIPGDTDVSISSVGEDCLLLYTHGRTLGLSLADALAIQQGLEAMLSGSYSHAISSRYQKEDQDRPSYLTPIPSRNRKPSLDDL